MRQGGYLSPGGSRFTLSPTRHAPAPLPGYLLSWKDPMAIAAERGDLRYAVEFLATPMIVDLLRAVRHSTAANACLDVASDSDVVRQAIEVLAANGTVTCTPGDSAGSGRQRLSLTSKGRRVCDLVDELVGPGDYFADQLLRDYTWLPEELTRG
jgi:hypothetical protein